MFKALWNNRLELENKISWVDHLWALSRDSKRNKEGGGCVISVYLLSEFTDILLGLHLLQI